MGKHHHGKKRDPYIPIYIGLVGFLIVAGAIAYWMFS